MNKVKPEFEGRFLGVLGGMGPLAGATFMTRLTQLTQAATEQEHIPAMLWSDPRIPSRPKAYLGTGEDPSPWMMNGVRHMSDAGAKAIVIPCNTAHLWYEPLRAYSSVPILHIVDAVLANLRAQRVDSGRVGVLATQATLQSQLYQSSLRKQGYEPVLLEPDELETYCTQAIELVKDNQLEAAYQALSPGMERMLKKDVRAVVLACTELPLALPHAQRAGWGVPIVDSIDALALAAIAWYENGLS